LIVAKMLKLDICMYFGFFGFKQSNTCNVSK